MGERVTAGWWRRVGTIAVAVLIVGVCACAPSPDAPTPRPIIIHSGARLTAAPERMEQIDPWLRNAMETIQEDPTFLINTIYVPEMVYPWDGLDIEGDTARVAIQNRAADAQTPYMIYAFLHLMSLMGRLDEWLPDAQGREGFALERAILAQVSDVWLYGRTVFDASAHQPLEELMYSNENGYLDAFILTARPDEFPEERETWLKAVPNGQEQYVAWFRQTFEDLPPGLRPKPTVTPPDSVSSDTARVGRAGERVR